MGGYQKRKIFIFVSAVNATGLCAQETARKQTINARMSSWRLVSSKRLCCSCTKSAELKQQGHWRVYGEAAVTNALTKSLRIKEGERRVTLQRDHSRLFFFLLTSNILPQDWKGFPEERCLWVWSWCDTTSAGGKLTHQISVPVGATK